MSFIHLLGLTIAQERASRNEKQTDGNRLIQPLKNRLLE